MTYHQKFAVMSLLRAGFGAEDIALRTAFPVEAIRERIADLRVRGRLRPIYTQARIMRGRAA